jgi:alcohol dehydrogenase
VEDAMIPYEVLLPKATEVGCGLINNLGPRLAGKKVGVVTYRPSPRQMVLKERLQLILVGSGVNAVYYDAIYPDPDIECIDKGADLCKKECCDVILAVGGGSVIDSAKCIAMLFNNPGSIRDYQMGNKQIEKPGLPLVAVPITAGAGSEATAVAVITNREEEIKKSIRHPYLVPNTVLIDPELTVTLPPRLTISFAMDALSHGIESLCSLNANPITETFSLQSIELIINNLRQAVTDGDNLTVREQLSVASYLAGASLNAGVGAAHILAHPLGAVYGISHGDACAVLLLAVMKANFDYCLPRFAKMARAIGFANAGIPDKQAALKGLSAIEQLYIDLDIPQRISQLVTVKKDSLVQIIESAAKSTSHIKTNPRPVDESLMCEILEKAI